MRVNENEFYSYTLDFIRCGDNVSNKSFWKSLQQRSQQLVREDVVDGGRFILPTLSWRTELTEVTWMEGQREASTPLRSPPNRAGQQWIHKLWVRTTASVQGGKTTLKKGSLHLLTGRLDEPQDSFNLEILENSLREFRRKLLKHTYPILLEFLSFLFSKGTIENVVCGL